MCRGLTIILHDLMIALLFYALLVHVRPSLWSTNTYSYKVRPSRSLTMRAFYHVL